MIIEIDIETLRKDLINYFGTAMFASSPLAMIELSKVENASDEDLIEIAKNNNIDLNKYIINSKGGTYVRK